MLKYVFLSESRAPRNQTYEPSLNKSLCRRDENIAVLLRDSIILIPPAQGEREAPMVAPSLSFQYIFKSVHNFGF